MSTCATANRRRRQAVNGYRHLGPLVRPVYKKKSLQKSQRRLAQVIEMERRMQQNKGKASKAKKAA